jgi:hypothetical protein
LRNSKDTGCRKGKSERGFHEHLDGEVEIEEMGVDRRNERHPKEKGIIHALNIVALASPR